MSKHAVLHLRLGPYTKIQVDRSVDRFNPNDTPSAIYVCIYGDISFLFIGGPVKMQVRRYNSIHRHFYIYVLYVGPSVRYS